VEWRWYVAGPLVDAVALWLARSLTHWLSIGNKVYVTGTFNGWKEKIPLHRSERDFTTIQYLPPGVHQYKFIVDGRWRHATDQPVAADVSGNLNNCVEIRAMSQTSLASSLGTDGGTTTFTPRSPPGDYDQDEELDDTIFIKEPPSLPPHLMRALLNTAPVSKDDPVLLPLPHHVMIDHCYFLSRPGVPDEQTMKDVRVVGMTHRYRAKFVTTVFYVPVEEPSPSQD